jgi:hypothetical protein
MAKVYQEETGQYISRDTIKKKISGCKSGHWQFPWPVIGAFTGPGWIGLFTNIRRRLDNEKDGFISKDHR